MGNSQERQLLSGSRQHMSFSWTRYAIHLAQACSSSECHGEQQLWQLTGAFCHDPFFVFYGPLDCFCLLSGRCYSFSKNRCQWWAAVSLLSLNIILWSNWNAEDKVNLRTGCRFDNLCGYPHLEEGLAISLGVLSLVGDEFLEFCFVQYCAIEWIRTLSYDIPSLVVIISVC